jgi:hypothetical protein
MRISSTPAARCTGEARRGTEADLPVGRSGSAIRTRELFDAWACSTRYTSHEPLRAGAQSASALPADATRAGGCRHTARGALVCYSPRHQAAHEVSLDLTPVTKTGEPFASGLLLNPLLRRASAEMSIGRDSPCGGRGQSMPATSRASWCFDDTEPVSGQAALSTSVGSRGQDQAYYLLGNARTARLELSPVRSPLGRGTAGVRRFSMPMRAGRTDSPDAGRPSFDDATSS